MNDELTQVLTDTLLTFAEKDREGNPANLTDGLFAIAHSLESVARALRDLGNADAATPMGAMEALGLVLKDGMSEIAGALADRGDG